MLERFRNHWSLVGTTSPTRRVSWLFTAFMVLLYVAVAVGPAVLVVYADYAIGPAIEATVIVVGGSYLLAMLLVFRYF